MIVEKFEQVSQPLYKLTLQITQDELDDITNVFGHLRPENQKSNIRFQLYELLSKYRKDFTVYDGMTLEKTYKN